MAAKPVIVELPDKQRVGVASPAAANRVYPDGKIVGHQDGTPYEPSPTPARGKTAKPSRKASNPVKAPKPSGATANSVKAPDPTETDSSVKE